MDILSRRDFLKSSVKAGTAVLGMAAIAELAANNLSIGTGIAEAAGPSPEYEIFACKYGGSAVRSKAIPLYNKGWNETYPLSFFVWAVKAKSGETIVVDTGTGPVLAETWKALIPDYVDPVNVLARIGATAATVSKVVLTHSHGDHISDLEGFWHAFPKAKFYIQKREFDFYVKNPLSQRKPIGGLFDGPTRKFLGQVAGSDRLVIVDGDYNLASGLELLLTPGHTPGLQSLLVNTAKGPALVGSDLAHIFEGYRENTGSVHIIDQLAWMQSFDKVKAKAPLDMLFPGHDILMYENYPEVADGVTQLV